VSDQHSTFRNDLIKQERNRPNEIAPAKNGSSKDLAPAEDETRSLLDYLPASMSDEQKTKMRKVGKRIQKYQHAGKLPMLCTGMQCPFASYCELVENDVDLPVGDPCPLEDFAVDAFMDEFKEHYKLDERDPQAFWVLQLMRDLAGDMVVQTRVNQSLAMDPAPIDTAFGGISFSGQALEITKLKPTLDYMLRLNANKLKIIKEMLGTPKSKAEAGRLGADDPSSSTADAQARANKLRQLAQLGQDTPEEREKPALPQPKIQTLDFEVSNEPVAKPEPEGES